MTSIFRSGAGRRQGGGSTDNDTMTVTLLSKTTSKLKPLHSLTKTPFSAVWIPLVRTGSMQSLSVVPVTHCMYERASKANSHMVKGD